MTTSLLGSVLHVATRIQVFLRNKGHSGEHHEAATWRLLRLGVVGLVCLLALSSQLVKSQVLFGSLVGDVVDASGAAVPGAAIKITLATTSDTRTAETDATGGYTISTVTPGTCRDEITKEGYRSFVATDILVNQNNVVRVDAQLQVGSLAEVGGGNHHAGH